MSVCRLNCFYTLTSRNRSFSKNVHSQKNICVSQNRFVRVEQTNEFRTEESFQTQKNTKDRYMRLLLTPILAVALVMLLFPLNLLVQERTATASGPDYENNNHTPSWHVGINGGVPLGWSTFKARGGYGAGVFGGYRFSPVLSLEAQAAWGKVKQEVRDCCAGYWLGADGNRYEAAVAGMDGLDYKGLRSEVFLQRYGLQLNVNLLGFFHATKDSRWTVELSPSVSAVGTDSRWHLGVGGNLQAGYRITRYLDAGIYSGLTHLTGDPMDGIPRYLHKENFIWESGIRIGWTFGRKKKAATIKQPRMETTMPAVQQGKKDSIPVATVPEVTPIIEATDSAAVAPADTSIVFPTIYFRFNDTSIAGTELPKAQQILELLNEHPDVCVLITGWCDTKGRPEVNDRYSSRRAETVKAWLVAHGIEPGRISTVGKGSDSKNTDAAKARRADIEERKEGKR